MQIHPPRTFSRAGCANIGGDPCVDDGLCELQVESAGVVECEGDTGQETSLSATQDGAGTLAVVHLAVQDGCCPVFSATAQSSLNDKTLTVVYDFGEDDCDCICSLDVGYTLKDVPVGNWTLTAHGSSIQVEVE